MNRMIDTHKYKERKQRGNWGNCVLEMNDGCFLLLVIVSDSGEERANQQVFKKKTKKLVA